MVGSKNLRFLLDWMAKKGCFVSWVAAKEIFKPKQRSCLTSGYGEVTASFVDFLCEKICSSFFFFKKYFGEVRN